MPKSPRARVRELPPALVLVGYRRAAFAAARASGDDFVAVTSTDMAPRGALASLPFTAPPAPLAREIARVCVPLAVVALTEGAVMVAARLREALRLPGMTVADAQRCTDKAAMKAALRAGGLPCADYVTARDGLGRDALIERLGLPLVVKTMTGSGGRGARVCRRRQEVPPRLEPGWMAEAFVDGIEMSVEAFVPDGVPVFTNFTEYVEPRWANLVPAQVDYADEVLALQSKAITVLGADRCLTHLEAFLTRDGVVIGELAARPPGGHITTLMAAAYNADPWQAVLRTAIGVDPQFPARAPRCAGVRLFHPGPGVVAEIAGADAVAALPGFHDQRWRIAPGVEVGERAGTGQEAGHVLFVGSCAEVRSGLTQAREAVRITMARDGDGET